MFFPALEVVLLHAFPEFWEVVFHALKCHVGVFDIDGVVREIIEPTLVSDLCGTLLFPKVPLAVKAP